MSRLRLTVFLAIALIALPACTEDEDGAPAESEVESYWVSVVESSPSSNEPDFEIEVSRVRQVVGEESFGTELVVSPVRCFPELLKEYQGKETDYVLLLRALDRRRAEDLAGTVGDDELVLVSSTDICVG